MDFCKIFGKYSLTKAKSYDDLRPGLQDKLFKWVYAISYLWWKHNHKPSWINIVCVRKRVFSVILKSQKLQVIVKNDFCVVCRGQDFFKRKLIPAQVTLYALVRAPLWWTHACACSYDVSANVKSHWEHFRRKPSWTDATWLFKLACCATSKWHWSHLNCDSSFSNFQWL